MGVIDPARRAQQFGENGAGLLFALCDDLGTNLPSLPAPHRFMGALTVATRLNRSPLFSQYLARGDKRTFGSRRMKRESVCARMRAASTLTRPIPRRSSMPATCDSLATLERPKRCSIAKSFAESISTRFSDAPLTLAIRNDSRWSGVICERQLANCASPPECLRFSFPEFHPRAGF